MSTLADTVDAGGMTPDVAPAEEEAKHAEESEAEIRCITRGGKDEAVKVDMNGLNGHENARTQNSDSGENMAVNVASDDQVAEKEPKEEKCIPEPKRKAHSTFDVALSKLIGDPGVALSKISEQILTLSCLTKLRAGRVATAGELALAADTYALMTSLMCHVAPKSVVDKRAIANVALDLGLREPPPKKRRVIPKPVCTAPVLPVAAAGCMTYGSGLKVQCPTFLIYYYSIHACAHENANWWQKCDCIIFV